MRKSRYKLLKFLAYFVLPITFFSVIIFTVLAFKRLVLPYDKILKNGKTVLQVSQKLRLNLLKRADLTSVFFNSKDGVKLSGLLVKRKTAIGNVVLCHGYQSTKEFLGDIIDMLPEYNVLLFDFRAHGKSAGRFRTLGCHEYKDLFAAVDFLKDKMKPKNAFSKKLPLYILGISMGGSVAIDAASRRSDLCDGLIADSSFADLNSVIYNAFKIKSGLPKYPFVPILIRMVNFATTSNVNKVSPINFVGKVKQPIFFIHSCIDNVVDPSDALKMYAKSKNPKSKLWISPTCRHARLHRTLPDIYKKKINKFLKNI